MSDTVLRPDSQGKVRDIYEFDNQLVIVASDRISAFDHILPDEIPHKGEILTRLSLFWFKELRDVVRNHLVSADVSDLPDELAPYAEYLAGRFMLVEKAEMFPVECIVRGYLAGSGLKEYQASGSVCGISLPAGLVEASKIPQAIYTPSTKAAIGDHDENVSFERTVDMLGRKQAEELRDMSLSVYEKASVIAKENGVIIADTKFEFGLVDGCLTLADEVLTPDSSRFWSVDDYREGTSQASFDKQFVRDWLSANWDGAGEPPHLSADVIEATSAKYIQAYELITGECFVPTSA